MKRVKQTYRKLSVKERHEYDRLHHKLDRERPELESWANATLDRLETIDRVVSALRAARRRKRLTLAQIADASGLGPSVVSRLENAEDPNPTLDTLLELARAIGVELRIAVVDKTKSGVARKQTHRRRAA